MRGYSCVTQRFNDLAKVGSHVLKDQREADHVRLIVADALKNLVGIRTISHDGRLVARGVHGRHQIPQSEIVLILKTDQQDLLCAARRLAHGYLHWQGWKFSHHWPPFLERNSYGHKKHKKLKIGSYNFWSFCAFCGKHLLNDTVRLLLALLFL